MLGHHGSRAYFFPREQWGEARGISLIQRERARTAIEAEPRGRHPLNQLDALKWLRNYRRGAAGWTPGP